MSFTLRRTISLQITNCAITATAWPASYSGQDDLSHLAAGLAGDSRLGGLLGARTVTPLAYAASVKHLLSRMGTEPTLSPADGRRVAECRQHGVPPVDTAARIAKLRAAVARPASRTAPGHVVP